LTKIDNLIGLLSTGSTDDSFDSNLEPLQAEFQAHGVEPVITRLLTKKDASSVPMEVETASNN
jgi:hypothetical protein